jgi:hypothetical protein
MIGDGPAAFPPDRVVPCGQSLPKETIMSVRALRPWSRCHARVAALAVLTVVALFAVAGSAQAAAPSNDDFANAITLSGASGSESGTNVEATAQAGEPNNHQAEFFDGGDLGNTSVWYEWTAPASGLVGFDTDDPGTNYDTVLGVYTGSLGSLNEVEFNDDYGGPAAEAGSCSTPPRARRTSSQSPASWRRGRRTTPSPRPRPSPVQAARWPQQRRRQRGAGRAEEALRRG